MAIPDEPLARSEQYLNRTATGSGTIPNEPLTRVEMYLNKIATGSGNTPDEPLTRVEMYLDEIAEHGGGGVDPGDITLQTLNVSQNGTTNAPSGKAYNKVVANVPNTYAASDEGKVVDNGALVAQTAHAEVTQNGTVDTTLNNSVVVNVPRGWTTDRIATNSEPSGALTINAETISDGAFSYKTRITSINCTNTTTINNKAFIACDSLANASLPKVTKLGSGSFRYCPIQTIVLPSISVRLDGAVFENCSQLRIADFGISCPSIEGYCFSNCSRFETLVIRKNGVPSLSTNAFNGTKFASNGTGGTLYVPQAQITTYQASTNWSVILGNANNRILPIEGSIYENQYADGTPISTT